MKNQIIYVRPSHGSFTKVDKDILLSEFRVTDVCLNQDKGRLAYLVGLFKLKLSMATNSSAKLVLIWFADYHAFVAVFLAKFFRMKSIVMIGGYDAVCYPEFRYGAYCNKLRGWCAAYALKHANLIIANHQALLDSQNYYYNQQGHPEGVFQLIRGLSTKAEVIYNSITFQKAEEVNPVRQKQILCVGGTPRYEDVFNKGYDLIFAVAAMQQDWQFVMVGINQLWMPRLEKDFRISALTNVLILPNIPHEEVLDLMKTSSIYLQPSISEGMPNALMEAMLCGCIPVGSNVAGIPTIIDDHGFVFDQRSPKALHEVIQLAMSFKVDRQAISESIIRRFNLSLRKQAMLESLSRLIGVT
jgi:glycosyltransferase involved in cell wall biosynthesis